MNYFYSTPIFFEGPWGRRQPRWRLIRQATLVESACSVSCRILLVWKLLETRKASLERACYHRQPPATADVPPATAHVGAHLRRPKFFNSHCLHKVFRSFFHLMPILVLSWCILASKTSPRRPNQLPRPSQKRPRSTQESSRYLRDPSETARDIHKSPPSTPQHSENTLFFSVFFPMIVSVEALDLSCLCFEVFLGAL